jgi:peptide/nickel transport system ATP-binding protein
MRARWWNTLMESIPKLGRKFSSGKQDLKEIPGMVPNLIRLPPGCLFEPRCGQATEQCKKARPPLVKLNHEHGVKCWLAQDKG